MAKKVNITVPDELHEKMQKCRKDFNFSAIFQEAVAEAIERKESFRKRLEEDEDMAAIVERRSLREIFIR
jgi:post-segregation antitoxin (ccd killing protein)